ncbi:hypothetical protein K9N68_26570 [Kovacikia minuta CCNUW1]|uniref:hypothetical protein n=1 Tax=Kovacikia minuta TaxID=2931930 RepID=UPI001CCC114D|nr:hypothetical protein [Kovacikia minuta]UBF25162.1 hypothetical protein K9N68_26570 [Kovacikia minuta CCNUW1]
MPQLNHWLRLPHLPHFPHPPIPTAQKLLGFSLILLGLHGFSPATAMTQAIAQPVPHPTPHTPHPTPQVSSGNQVILNGRSFQADWSQWQTESNGIRIGISDAGLIQTTGFELLNTEDSTKQPIQWFSDPATNPLSLPTRLAGSCSLSGHE